MQVRIKRSRTPTSLPLAGRPPGLDRMQAQAASAKPVGKHFDQVVIVMMENAGTDQALADPYISSLSRKAAWFRSDAGPSRLRQAGGQALRSGSDRHDGECRYGSSARGPLHLFP